MPEDGRGDDGYDGRYRDPDPTRRLPRGAGGALGGRGDGLIRDPLTGRPTPPRFLGSRDPRPADDGRGGDEAPAALDRTRAMPVGTGAAAPAGEGARSASSAPRRAAARERLPDPDDTRYAAHVPAGYRAAPPQGPPPSGPPRPATRPGGPAVPARPAARRGRRPLRLLRTILVLLLVLAIAYPLSLGIVAWRNVGRTGELPAVADTPGTTYLLVGSDSREGLTGEDVGYLNSGTAEEAGGQRTDTILLLHAPGGGQQPVLVSIPRDSYVAIPGNGQNKINAAYAFGGPALLAQTITDATGIGVDSYVETGLGGFAAITDAIGGVETCLPEALADPNAGIDLPAGCQTLNGAQALGLARSRKTDARGDLARVERQRAVLSAIVTQAADPATVLNPFTGYRVAAAGGSALSVDDGTGPLDVGRFVLAMRTVASGGGITLTVPVSNANLSTPAGSAVEWDPQLSEQLWSALRADDTATVAGIAAAQEPAVQAPTLPDALPAAPTPAG